MMYNISDFSSNVVDYDFQRPNRFSLIMATNPMNKFSDIISSNGGGTLVNGGSLGWNLLGDNMFNNLLNNTMAYGVNKIINKTGIRRYMIGAMNNRLVESILGSFPVGQEFIDFFSIDYADKGLWIESVTPPASALDYEMDLSYKAPNIRIKGRNYDTLVTRFRMDSLGKNFMAFTEWNQSIKDPITGLVAFMDEVDMDIQVNLHDRNGIPHTTLVFNGCVPISVKESEVYDNETHNTIQTFDVIWAYRSYFTGKVELEKALEWLASRTVDSIIGKAGMKNIDQRYNHMGQQTFNVFGKY